MRSNRSLTPAEPSSRRIKRSSLAVRLAMLLTSGLSLAPLLASAEQAPWYQPSASAYLIGQPTLRDVGGTGLMQVPNARMSREGEASLLYYDNDEYRRMAITLQLFPWLETVIRYNDIRTRKYSDVPDFSGDQTYKDRGFDAKIRLWQESRYWPQISLGLQDMAGTGKFSAEYIVASKRWQNFDVTLGMGWGVLGTADDITNPFCELGDRFCERKSGFEGTGGDFEVDDWFAGPAALFAGVEYQTPWDPLVLKLEYEGNDYTNEFSTTKIEQDSRFNLGAHLRFSDNLNLQLSFERGNTLMFGVNVRANFNDLRQLRQRAEQRDWQDVLGSAYTANAAEADTGADTDTGRPTPDKASGSPVSPIRVEKLRSALAAESKYSVSKLVLSEDGTTLTVEGYPSGMFNKSLAVKRAGRIIIDELPFEQAMKLERIEFINRITDMSVAQINVDARQLRRQMRYADILADGGDIRDDANEAPDSLMGDTIYQLQNPQRDSAAGADNTGHILYDYQHQLEWPSYSVRPRVTQSIGGPENFYLYRIQLDAIATWRPHPKVIVDGAAAVALIDKFDEFNFTGPTGPDALPRVRTYIREYTLQSDVWLEHLQATYHEQLNTNWYTSVYGGYFERMFAGVGGEVLYHPLNRGWAVGLDVNYAKQRSFNSQFGLRDYDTVTGHMTAYLQPDILTPAINRWLGSALDDTMVKVSAGRFLAEDVGVQVNVEKQFDSGVIVGAFAAKTDVSAEEFGEGSFNKGFYISLPFELMQMFDSGSRAAFGWAPITRDGGQMLNRPRRLYDMTQSRSNYYTPSTFY
jgi:hypothetical protein